LADTRGIEHDERHKNSIATQIKKNIDSVTAILILTNGTTQRLSASTDYALSTLSALFPKTLAKNIAFVFTNVPNLLSWNFCEDSIPSELKNAPQFLLDNPLGLQKNYNKLKSNPNMQKKQKAMLSRLETTELEALETLVQLFDWLDDCEPQPTKEIIYLYELSQEIESSITDTLAQIDQVATKKVEIDKLIADLKNNSDVSSSPCSHRNLTLMLVGRRLWMLLPTLGRPSTWSSGSRSAHLPITCYAARSTAIPTAASTTRPISYSI
jgi:hypothetical protein